MRFLFDESADARIRPFLQEQGHDVTRIASEYLAGLSDGEVLALAHRETRILITSDRDFGALVFVEHQPHAGVILLRLGVEVPLARKIALLGHVFEHHWHELDQFIVMTPHTIRVRR